MSDVRWCHVISHPETSQLAHQLNLTAWREILWTPAETQLSFSQRAQTPLIPKQFWYFCLSFNMKNAHALPVCTLLIPKHSQLLTWFVATPIILGFWVSYFHICQIFFQQTCRFFFRIVTPTPHESLWPTRILRFTLAWCEPSCRLKIQWDHGIEKQWEPFII